MVSFKTHAVAYVGVLAAGTCTTSTTAAATATATATTPSTPPSDHPPIPGLTPTQLRRFASNLNCPYASEWLTKGPERASRDMAARSRRRAREDQSLMPDGISGSCTFPNPFTDSDGCTEFRGPTWTDEEMTSRCDARPGGGGGVLSVGSDAASGCALPPDGKLAGWCAKEADAAGRVEATMMALSGGMSCAAVGGACTSFAGGDQFVPDGACLSTDEGDDGSDGSTKPEWTTFDLSSIDGGSGAATCAIAPGPAGAAHQAPLSSGYRAACPETPAEASPYQWPLRWSADVESKSVSYASDAVTYVSKSRVWYRLDRNWKRLDNYLQKGTVPFFSRSTEDDDYVDETERSTMIHRGGKMYFITYRNGTLGDDASNIKECNWLDLGIVGNIRPDWYLDDRGGATEAQYLGNQHVYYPGKAGGTAVDGNADHLEELTVGSPRLVRQWRKKDFADQYFTMSMKEHVGEDNVHWPLILNIPGEGFGDDMLQFYDNHELLGEDFTDAFLLDEAFAAAGGRCINLRPDGQGGGEGPPAMEYVPSNLEIDEDAWVKNVWTGSPVWEPPAESNEEAFAGSASSIVGEPAKTDAGPSTVVTSCYDEPSNAVELSITYSGLTVGSDGSIPWLGLAFREDEVCAMTPVGGGDAEVALVLTDEFGALSPLHFMMSPATKGMGIAAGGRSGLGYTPLEDREEYTDVSVTHSAARDSVTLKFSKAMDAIPDVMHLTYAVGSSSTFGYHNVRTCFDVEAFPTCPSGDRVDHPTSSTNGSAMGLAPTTHGTDLSSSSAASAMFGAVVSATLAFGLATFGSF